MMTSALHINRVFHALGDPTRRTILERVSGGPVSVSDLAGPLKMTLAAVVQHIQILEEGGLVQTQKIGRVRTCALKAEGFELASKWISARKISWEKKLDRLGDLLDQATDSE